jgi:hypothetical protein
LAIRYGKSFIFYFLLHFSVLTAAFLFSLGAGLT